MKRSKLLTLLIGVCLVLALVAVPFMSACAPEVVEEEEEEEEVEEVKWVTIGLCKPMTGPVGTSGVGFKQGITLAFDEINEAGGILVNGQRYMLELEIFDTRYDSKLAIAGLTKLAEMGIKLIIGPWVPAACIAASPMLWEHKAIMLTVQGSTTIKKANLINHFQVDTTEERSANLTKYLTEGLGVKTAAFALGNFEYDLEQKEYFIPALEAKGVEVVTTELFELGTEDFYTVIAKIREADPDVVVTSLACTERALFQRQRMELNYPVQCVTIDSMSQTGAPAFRIAGAAGAEGCIGGCFFFDPFHEWADWEIETMGIDMAILDRFTRGSLENYGLDWYGAQQVFGYSLAYLAADVMERAGTVTDGEALLAAVETTNLSTALLTFRYAPGSRCAMLPRILVQEYVVDEVTGEFRLESIAGVKAIDPYGHEWEIYVHKELNIDDIRAGIVPGTASYGNPY